MKLIQFLKTDQNKVMCSFLEKSTRQDKCTSHIVWKKCLLVLKYIEADFTFTSLYILIKSTNLFVPRHVT